MYTQSRYDVRLPSHLAHLSDKLSRKMIDDAAMYDILAISKQTSIFYFLEPNETHGGVGFFTEANVPDSLFSSGTLVGVSDTQHDNAEAIYSRIFVTIPFAEKEEKPSFQNAPRKTKYPVISKAVLQKSINDLNKLGVNRLVDVNKLGHELFDKYNNVNLLEDVIGVDDKRQQQITKNIAKRSRDHQHVQLHYNQLAFPPANAASNADSHNALFAIHWFDHGGAEKFALASMQKAHDMGFKLFCIVDKRGNKHYLSQALTLCEHVFNIAEGLPAEYWQRFYLNVCTKLNIQLFHIHHAISAYQALPKIKALTNVKVTLDTTHIVEHTDGGYVRVSGVFSQYLNYHHTISQELNGYLANEIHVPRHKIKLGYLFNQASELQSDSTKFDQIGERCVVSFVGRLVNQKRPYLFIELVKQIVTHPQLKSRKIEFNMVGEGPLWQVCEDLINQYNLTAKINVLPANTDVHALLSRTHFLVIPSENEGLTLVAYEATLNNCIVISTDVGSQREIVASDALLSRYPKPFIEGSIKLIDQAIHDTNFAKQLLQQQYDQINAIIAQQNWEAVLEPIYHEALHG